MMPRPRIGVLVCSDGSADSREAIDLLCRLLPSDSLSSLTLLRVIETGPSFGAAGRTPLADSARARHRAEQRRALSRDERELEHFSSATEAVVRYGHPAEEILKIAEERRSQLVVLGAQGRSLVERFMLGSVSEKVLRHCKSSVLIARPSDQPRKQHATDGPSSRPLTVLAGYDRSEVSAAAIRTLADLASGRLSVELLTVLEEDAEAREQSSRQGTTQHQTAEAALEDLAKSIESSVLSASWNVRSGRPAQMLLERAEEMSCDLIAVGDRGRSALERFFLGSVSARIARHAPCAVWLHRKP